MYSQSFFAVCSKYDSKSNSLTVQYTLLVYPFFVVKFVVCNIEIYHFAVVQLLFRVFVDSTIFQNNLNFYNQILTNSKSSYQINSSRHIDLV